MRLVHRLEQERAVVQLAVHASDQDLRGHPRQVKVPGRRMRQGSHRPVETEGSRAVQPKFAQVDHEHADFRSCHFRSDREGCEGEGGVYQDAEECDAGDGQVDRVDGTIQNCSLRRLHHPLHQR